MNEEKNKADGDGTKQPFTPLKKQSKQKQKKYHASKRGTWGEINPVTRKPPNPKAYRRRKSIADSENGEE